MSQNKSVMHSDTTSLDIPAYIDRPEYVKNKSAGYLLQIVGWGIWMWLLMPLVTLFLWWFEGKMVYEQLFLSLHTSGKYSLYNLGVCITVLVALLWIWASYNWIRFVNNERRSSPKPACLDQLSQSLNVSTADLKRMRAHKNLTLYYNDQGELLDYENNVSDQRKKSNPLVRSNAQAELS